MIITLFCCLLIHLPSIIFDLATNYTYLSIHIIHVHIPKPILLFYFKPIVEINHIIDRYT